MMLPGFTADVSLYTSTQHLMSTHTVPSKELSGIYPAALGDGGGIDGGFDTEPCLSSRQCSACIPTGTSIFSPGRQFCINSICTPRFNGCSCQVFKGWVSCQLPRPVLTTGFGR